MQATTMRTMIAVLFTALLLFAAGCGQKGPLYLPDDDAEQSG